MPTVLKIDASTYPVYGSEDLNNFQQILDDMLDELRDLNDAPLPEQPEAVLKVRLAAALFKAAENGERDPQRLREQALAALAHGGKARRPEADS